nr:glycosyltransferase family 4 protein [Gramella sp. AN32]
MDSLKYYLNRVETNIYISRFLENYYSKFSETQKSLVVYNGQKCENSVIIRDNFTILRFGIVGRLNKQKNQVEIIELFQSLCKDDQCIIELHLFGGGFEEVEDTLVDPTNSKIVFHGFKSAQDIYQNLDILIANARHEAFGRTLLEANLSGIPVLALNSGAFPEIVEECVNGWIYDNLSELRIKILELAKMKDRDYKAISLSSKKYAAGRFSREEMSRKVYQRIGSIISKNNDPI